MRSSLLTLFTWVDRQTRFSLRSNLVCFTAHFIHFGHKFDQKCLFTDSLHRLGSRFARTSSVPFEKIYIFWPNFIFRHVFEFFHQNWKKFHFIPKKVSNTLFEKSNFCPKIQFWQNPNIFTSFSPKFFWQFFSWNQSCQQLKSPKPQHFHEFFTQIFFDNFSREIKVVNS